ENQHLVSLPLTRIERRFANGFPGRIGRFSDGHRQVVVRWISHETRQLHPSADCFKGCGYDITPLPLLIDDTGRKWECYRANSLTDNLTVRELVCDESGHSWADVSQWYWAAVLGKTRGPWWVYTVAE